MYCEHCGEKIPEYSRFCEQCGKPVTIQGAPNLKSPAPLPQQPARVFPGLSSGTAKRGKSPDYSRIVFWIQRKYGSLLEPGMDAGQVQMQLESIIRSEQARGIPANALKGFRAFINQQHSGMLLQTRR